MSHDHDVADPTPTCRRCASELPNDCGSNLAPRCPSCGFDPQSKHYGKMRFWGLITAFLCVTVVGLPLAVVTGHIAAKHRRELKRGLTA